MIPGNLVLLLTLAFSILAVPLAAPSGRNEARGMVQLSDRDRRRSLLYAALGFLQLEKPFTLDGVAHKLREVLNAHGWG